MPYVINIYIFLTVSWFFIAKSRHTLLGVILITTLLNIIVVEILMFYEISFSIFYNFYILITLWFWLKIILQHYTRTTQKIVLYGYILLAIVTFSMHPIFTTFNKSLFVLSSLIYVILFLWLSYKNLLKDTISFFQKPNFLLLFAPVIFFLGMSLIWGFQSNTLSRFLVMENLTLYHAVNFVGNIIFYTLINIYIFKTRKKI
jgi:hypothetical protein